MFPPYFLLIILLIICLSFIEEVLTIRHTLPFILFICIIFLLSGCWNKRELNELAIVTAVGIDKTDELLEVSVQIVNPSQVASNKAISNQAPVFTYHAKGKTLLEAIRKLTTLTPRKPYYAHAQVIIIGEKLAEEGMNSVFDLFQRDAEGRNDIHVIIAHQATAQEVLSILTPLEDIPASKIIKSLKDSEDMWGATESVTLDHLVNDLTSTDHSAILPSIKIYGNADKGKYSSNVEQTDSPAQLQYNGLAILKNYRLIGFLSEEESRDYNLLNNNINSTFETISCPEQGKLATKILHASTKITGHILNNRPSIRIQLDIEQNIAEISCHLDVTKSETIDALNQETSKVIRERLVRTLHTIQKTYRADLLKFDKVLYRKDYKAWHRIKKDWATIYPEIAVDLDVSVKTKGFGTATSSKLSEDTK